MSKVSEMLITGLESLGALLFVLMLPMAVSTSVRTMKPENYRRGGGSNLKYFDMFIDWIVGLFA